MGCDQWIKLRLAAFAAALFVAIAGPMWAEEERLSRKQRIFSTLSNIELPFTNPDSAIQVRYKIKAGDVIDDPYIRLPLEVRYGISDFTEIALLAEPFIKNPLDSDPRSSSGLAGIGLKHRVRDFVDERWELALGFKWVASLEPVPRFDIRHDYSRFEPYVTTVYRPAASDRWHIIGNARIDLIGDNPFRDIDRAQTPYSTFYLRPGIVLTPPGEWRYSLEVEYQTDRLDGGSGDGLVIMPGIAWFPDELRIFRPLPGEFDFIVRFGYALSQLPIDRERSDTRVNLRMRWSYTKRN